MCSMINTVGHRLSQEDVPKHIVEIFDSGTKVRAEPILELAELCQVSPSTTIAGRQSKVEGCVEQEIFLVRENTKGKRQGFKLWTLREESQAKTDAGECSRAIFWPAIDNGDWDFSMVVTKVDESTSPSTQSLIEAPALTNRAVVEQLISSMFDRRLDSELIKILQLDQLIAANLPVELHVGTFIDADGDTRPSEVMRIARNKLEFLRLAGIVPPQTEQFHQIISHPGKPAFFKFTPDPEHDHYKIDYVVQNLGSTARTVPLGRLTVNEAYKEPVVQDTDGQPIQELPFELEKLFDVPDIVPADEALLKEIEAVFQDFRQRLPSARQDHSVIDSQLNKVLESFQRKHHESTGKSALVDIGTIDLRSLGSGDFLSDITLGHRLVARVLANKDQEVFCGVGTYYGCSVEGAGQAFMRTHQGKRLIASNCRSAFSAATGLASASLTDCAAIDCDKAFVEAAEIKGCIAENCVTAFVNSKKIEGSIAKHCKEAFTTNTSISVQMANNTAENCSTSFMDYYSRSVVRDNKHKVTGNTVLNPASRFSTHNAGGWRKKDGNQTIGRFAGPNITKAYRESRAKR